MSEFDKEYISGSSQDSDTVEAFEDFEITAQEVEAAQKAVEEVEAAAEAEEDAAEEIEAEEDAAEEIEAEEDAAEEIEAEDDAAEEIEEVEEVEDEFPIMIAASGSTEDDDEKTEDTDESDTEEVDEDDYLDYNDAPRPKKLVSGKTAVITMLTTCLVTICVIAGAFWLGVTMKKDIGVSVVSYTDRFNACDTKVFTLGQLMGIELVSMSDADYTLSAKDISDFKNGKKKKKFSNLVNIQANTRFGKIVSMDITFDPALNDLENPSAMYMVLLGNAISGLYPNVNSSDTAFVAAYSVLVTNCYQAPKKGSEVYMYTMDDIAIYADYSKMAKTGLRSDVTIHIENKDPDIIDTEKLDFSWIPFDFSSDPKPGEGTASPSDVSPSDK